MCDNRPPRQVQLYQRLPPHLHAQQQHRRRRSRQQQCLLLSRNLHLHHPLLPFQPRNQKRARPPSLAQPERSRPQNPQPKLKNPFPPFSCPRVSAECAPSPDQAEKSSNVGSTLGTDPASRAAPRGMPSIAHSRCREQGTRATPRTSTRGCGVTAQTPHRRRRCTRREASAPLHPHAHFEPRSAPACLRWWDGGESCGGGVRGV